MEAKGSGKDYWDSKRRSGYGGYGWQDSWKHGGGKPQKKYPQESWPNRRITERSPRDKGDKGAEKGKGGEKGGEKHNPKRGDFHQGYRKLTVRDGVIQD